MVNVKNRSLPFIFFFLQNFIGSSNLIDGRSQNKFLKYVTRIHAFYSLIPFPNKNREFCWWPQWEESRALKLHSKIFFSPFCFNVYIDVGWSRMKVSVFTFKDLCFMSLDMLMLPLGLFWMSALHRWPTAIYRHNNWTGEIRDKSVFSTWDAAGSTTLAGGITFVWQSPFLKHRKRTFFIETQELLFALTLLASHTRACSESHFVMPLNEQFSLL